MNIKTLAFLTLSLTLPIVSQANVIICDEGKVTIGDSLNKFERLCLKSENIKRGTSGMRPLGAKQATIQFDKFKKTFPDGSSVHFLFIDKKLAFVMD